VFAGQYKYSDGEYYYIYNSNGCYISLIIPVIDITPTGEGVISTIAELETGTKASVVINNEGNLR